MTLSKLASRRRGFTLIELMIVIVVIAILALIVIPRLMNAADRARQTTQAAVADVAAATSAQADWVANGFHGPYLTVKESEAIDPDILLPKNPYKSGSTVAAHWDYALDGTSFTLVPAD